MVPTCDLLMLSMAATIKRGRHSSKIPPSKRMTFPSRCCARLTPPKGHEADCNLSVYGSVDRAWVDSTARRNPCARRGALAGWQPILKGHLGRESAGAMVAVYWAPRTGDVQVLTESGGRLSPKIRHSAGRLPRLLRMNRIESRASRRAGDGDDPRRDSVTPPRPRSAVLAAQGKTVRYRQWPARSGSRVDATGAGAHAAMPSADARTRVRRPPVRGNPLLPHGNQTLDPPERPHHNQHRVIEMRIRRSEPHR
jgi:hypothetical protein